MALVPIASIGDISVQLDVDVSERAVELSITYTRQLRPRFVLAADGINPELTLSLQDGQGLVFRFPQRRQLTRTVGVHPAFGAYDFLQPPPHILYELEWQR